MDADLALALEICDSADRMTMARFRARDLRVETKPDMTPVTEVDREVEEMVRAAIARARPGHAVLGEEGGADAKPSPWRWLVDPIDGTRSYVRGVPVFATLLALEHDGVIVVGVVSAPALARRWWAVRGGGAFAGGSAIHVSAVRDLADAYISMTDIRDFDYRGLADRLHALAHRCWTVRGLGDFWSHVLVAEGASDIALEAEVSPWDVAAVQVIVEEAGGRFTDMSGAPGIEGGSAVSTNGLLHDDVVAAMGVQPAR